MEPGDDLLVRDLAGTPRQDLLPAPGDGEKAAFPGTLGLEIVIFKLGRELSGQMILQSPAGRGLLVGGEGEAGIFVENLDVEAGGGGKGVPLDVVDGQHKAAELPGACQRLVGRITFMVNRPQQSAKFVR